MPDLVFPAAIFPVADGDAIEAETLQDLIFDRGSPDESLAIINGLLDNDNIDASTEIQAEHTQRKSHVEIGGSSGTLNLDFTNHWFNSYDRTSSFSYDAEELEQGRAIPGGGTRPFFIRKESLVRFGWQVSWSNDNTSSITKHSAIYFKLHGPGDDPNPDAVSAQHRLVLKTFDSGDQEGYKRNRFWAGHHVAHIDEAGWYYGQLYVISHKDIDNTRIWARNMNYFRMGL
jgi:hypothetical protein